MPYQSDPLQPTLQKPAALPAPIQPMGAPQVTPAGLSGQIGQTQYNPGTGGASGTQNNAGNASFNVGSGSGGFRPNGAAPSFGDTAGDFRQFGDQYYNHTMGRMRGDMDRSNQALSQQLIDRGLREGSEGYNAEMDRMTRGNNDLMSATALGAEQLGLQAQNQAYTQAFGYDQLANQRDIAQIGAAAQTGAAGMGARASMYGADQQNYRADLANALGTNQLNENGRQFDIGNITQTQGMDQQFMLGLMNAQNNFMNTGINQFNTQQNANNQWWNQTNGMTANGPGVIFNPNTGYTNSAVQANQNHMGAIGADNQMMASLAGGFMGMSDSRLKENIEYIKTVDGVNVYEFDYIDKSIGSDRYRGGMADEVIQSHPEAIRWVDGFMAVIYDLLPINMEIA